VIGDVCGNRVSIGWEDPHSTLPDIQNAGGSQGLKFDLEPWMLNLAAEYRQEIPFERKSQRVRLKPGDYAYATMDVKKRTDDKHLP